MRWLLFNILLVFLFQTACSSRPPIVPVSSYPQPASTKVRHHIVARGETLYAIAWRYNMDHKSLAKANRLGDGARIYPGQKISLVALGPNDPAFQEGDKSWLPSWPFGSKDNAKTSVASSNNRLNNTSSRPVTTTIKSAHPATLRWYWPAQGKILKGFNANGGLNKGIDIGGELREPVVAAAPGTVVYAGDGLRGYGKLIILKHSDKFLSAYAHNRRVNVKEGDDVKANEKIAEMGDTGTDSVKLHFEIRFDGKPVDPLVYLPPK